jgi:FAD/FMN-containing dehydrogenase
VTRPPSPREWQNRSGSVACRPALRAAPAAESEVADLVRAAGLAGQPVRVAATGHSFVPLCASDGALLSLAGVQGVVSADW